MKGLIRNLVLAALGVSMLAGCGGNDKISVVSREEGSNKSVLFYVSKRSKADMRYGKEYKEGRLLRT